MFVSGSGLKNERIQILACVINKTDRIVRLRICRCVRTGLQGHPDELILPIYRYDPENENSVSQYFMLHSTSELIVQWISGSVHFSES
jgi:hypothetical protein